MSTQINYLEVWQKTGSLDKITNYDYFEIDSKFESKYNNAANRIKQKTILNNDDIDNYLNYIVTLHDRALAFRVILELFDKALFSDEQFEKVCKKIYSVGKWTKLFIKRQMLLRKIETYILN